MKKHFIFNPYTDVRWCPFVRFTTTKDNFQLSNRRDQSFNVDCIGPDCAAWVTVTDSDEHNEGYCGLIHTN